jgi:hypothetical protein
MSVLRWRGIYEVRPWDDVSSKFHEDWFRFSSKNLRGCNIGNAYVKGLLSTQLRWFMCHNIFIRLHKDWARHSKVVRGGYKYRYTDIHTAKWSTFIFSNKKSRQKYAYFWLRGSWTRRFSPQWDTIHFHAVFILTMFPNNSNFMLFSNFLDITATFQAITQPKFDCTFQFQPSEPHA